MRIWKYPLEVTDLQSVTMPRDAELLSIQMQGDKCNLWALVDETKPLVDDYTIAIYGTGHQIPDNPGKYLSTFQMYHGAAVFHAFEVQP